MRSLIDGGRPAVSTSVTKHGDILPSRWKQEALRVRSWIIEYPPIVRVGGNSSVSARGGMFFCSEQVPTSLAEAKTNETGKGQLDGNPGY